MQPVLVYLVVMVPLVVFFAIVGARGNGDQRDCLGCDRKVAVGASRCRHCGYRFQ